MRRLSVIAALLLFVLASCKFKAKDRPNWDTDLTAPLLKSRVTLADVLSDSSSNLIENSDNSLTVVYRDTVVDLRLADYLVVPDTSFGTKVTLDSLSLSTDTLTQDITLGQIARQLEAQGNPIGTQIINNHGGTLFFMPPINDLSSDDIDIDASQFFTEADLISGWMVVEVDNQLPVDITSVTFHLRNNSMTHTDTLVQKTIAPIPKGVAKKDSADLSGKTVVSQMAGKLEDIDVAGGTNIPIDTNDYIRMRVIVRDLGASSATAVFPAQTVLDDNSRIKYDFGSDLAITRMQVAKGDLRLQAVSTIQDTIEFTYTLPTAIANGQPVVVVDRLIPDTISGIAEADITFDLTDYYIDLTVNSDSVNLFPYQLVGNLLYSGRLNTMDLNDSIDVFYGLFDIEPSYIEGYLGRDTFDFSESLDFDFFNSILGGTIDLKEPKVDLTFTNSIGVDGELTINTLEAYNSRTGQTVALTGDVMNNGAEIRGPRLPNVGATVTSQINLNKSNSNIKEFMSLLPDRLDFDMSVLVNKNGNPALRDNFATNESRISAFLDLEVPLEGVANQLTLQDTVAVNITEATLPDGVVDGNIKLIVANYFPFDADVQIYFYDAGGAVFDSLFADGMVTVPGGFPNQTTGYVDEPGRETLSTHFDQARLDDLRLKATEAIIRFEVSTKPDGKAVKLYTTYGIDFHLVGDFRYTVGLSN